MWAWEGSCAISREKRHELSLEASLASTAKEASSLAERIPIACWPVVYRDRNSPGPAGRHRKQKSTIHAISYLQESIFNAWRGKKTLTLVSFDVKGAYNNVATEPLIQRLRQRRIPEPIVKWVQDFCTDRKACVMVNGFKSKVIDLPQAGLPQGSPLAPVLFLFFNANLVQFKIREGGSMAFVDDYTAWVVGESAKHNTRRMQREILPQLEKWERESGAVFESSKTAFIHFSRSYSTLRDSDMPLQFKRDTIDPS